MRTEGNEDEVYRPSRRKPVRAYSYTNEDAPDPVFKWLIFAAAAAICVVAVVLHVGINQGWVQ